MNSVEAALRKINEEAAGRERKYSERPSATITTAIANILGDCCYAACCCCWYGGESVPPTNEHTTSNDKDTRLQQCRYGAKILAALCRVKPDGYGELHGAFSILELMVRV